MHRYYREHDHAEDAKDCDEDHGFPTLEHSLQEAPHGRRRVYPTRHL
eukprot:COSAG03_NODE_24624_length_271_cov_0.598837_1_plen_46_part_10